VIAIDEHRLSEIVEKPVQRYLVNAGIYVLEPQAVALVPNGIPYDMPALFEEITRRGMGASVFPVREYWLDVGRIDDFNQANDDYFREFREFEATGPLR
jgi:NDP-sugar pyrophosphorylase family protein